MRELSAADTMLFEKDGKWWMLTNIEPAKMGDHCSELFIFSSDSPLSEDWKLRNPLISSTAYFAAFSPSQGANAGP